MCLSFSCDAFLSINSVFEIQKHDTVGFVGGNEKAFTRDKHGNGQLLCEHHQGSVQIWKTDAMYQLYPSKITAFPYLVKAIYVSFVFTELATFSGWRDVLELTEYKQHCISPNSLLHVSHASMSCSHCSFMLEISMIFSYLSAMLGRSFSCSTTPSRENASWSSEVLPVVQELELPPFPSSHSERQDRRCQTPGGNVECSHSTTSCALAATCTRRPGSQSCLYQLCSLSAGDWEDQEHQEWQQRRAVRVFRSEPDILIHESSHYFWINPGLFIGLRDLSEVDSSAAGLYTLVIWQQKESW